MSSSERMESTDCFKLLPWFRIRAQHQIETMHISEQDIFLSTVCYKHMYSKLIIAPVKAAVP